MSKKWMSYISNDSNTRSDQAWELGVSLPKYPASPGYKRDGTSKLAAEEMDSEASTLRMACLEAIRECPRTADEVAARLNKSVLAIRPRLSELLARGKITETGERRKNVSGKLATVWTITRGG